MYAANSSLLISCLTALSIANFIVPCEPRDHVTPKTERWVEKHPYQLKSIFYSSIIYWEFDRLNLIDTKKTEMKFDIMNKLVNINMTQGCDCPNIPGPVVCTKGGWTYSTICNFHCKLKDTDISDESVKPVMIFTNPESNSGGTCQLYNEGKYEYVEELLNGGGGGSTISQ